MDELVTIKYLTGCGSDKKLKRNVPKKLLKVADKTAWTKRVSNLSNSEIKEEAALFVVYTNIEIKTLKRKLTQLTAKPEKLEPSQNELHLSKSEARQLAVWYYWNENEERRNKLRYNISKSSADYDEVMLDAGNDVGDAVYFHEEFPSYQNEDAFSALYKTGFVSPEPSNRNEKKIWFNAVKKHPAYQLLCELIDRANLELANQRFHSLTNTKHVFSPDTFFTSLQPQNPNLQNPSTPVCSNISSKKITTLKQASDDFLLHKKQLVSSSRYDQYKIPIRALLEFIGNETDIRSIEKSDLFELRDFLPAIPAYVTRQFKRLTLQEAAKKFEKMEGTKANRYSEARKSLKAIGQVFDHAFDRDWVEKNPIDGLKLETPAQFRKKNYQKKFDGYAPYSNSELTKIFTSNVYTAKQGRSHFPKGNFRKSEAGKIIRDQMYWAPLLALWTGARMNEILQLERADVEQDGAVTFIQVTDEEEIKASKDHFRKKVKNSNAVRDIPLHNFLIDIGFFDWANQVNSGRLFPDAHRGAADKPSALYSKNYRGFGEQTGVWEYRKKVFHSYRSNFNDEMLNSGVDLDMRIAINGWEAQNKMDEIYGRGPKVQMLYEKAICKIDYKDIDWKAVKQSAKHFK